MPFEVDVQTSPMIGSPILRYANNGTASWVKDNALSQWQKGTGWQAKLYGGVQTGDDWAAAFIPIKDMKVPEFNESMWSYYMTGGQSMGVNIVIWVHDPANPSKRAEITQAGGTSGLGKATGWNSHVFNKNTTQMFFYGENTTGTALTAGTQYTWAQFQADILFKTWSIYRVSYEYGWEASGTFDYVWLVEAQINGQVIPFIPSILEVVTNSSFFSGSVLADWLNGGRLDLLLDLIKVQTDKTPSILQPPIDFWSGPVLQVQLAAAATTLAAIATVTVDTLPTGATVVMAKAMMTSGDRYNAHATTVNKLNGATVANTSQVIQVADDTPGTYYDAINFADDQYNTTSLAYGTGLAVIGSVNLAGAGKVDANDGYIFRWLLSRADLDFLNFNDVQFGLRLWYTV